MPRNLPLGNGNMLIAFDQNHQPREVYYPHVGQNNHALPSGVLAEQVNPYNNEPLSVSPLTWSHAAFLSIVHT